MEEHESTLRRRLGTLAREDLAEPIDVDEAIVLRQVFDGQVCVGRPGREAIAKDVDVRDAKRGETRGHRVRIAVAGAVDDDPAARQDALLVEDPLDLGCVDACQPGAGERDGAWNVSTACLAVEAPAVVGGERANVDDRRGRIGEEVADLRGRDLVGGLVRDQVCGCHS